MDEPGTSEAAWRGWPALREFPALHLAGVTSAVVIAPHPGDEVLAVGGVIAMLAEVGARLRVVAVSDEDSPRPGPAATRSAQWRLAEEYQALRTLEADEAETVRLGMVGGEVRDRAEELEDLLVRVCGGFDLCLAPWEGDRHPDHEAVAAAARVAAEAAGASLLSYPVWMWHWAAPGDPRVPWDRLHRIVLPEEARRAKANAISCFTSRNGPSGRAADGALTLPPEKVAHFTRDAETVFR
ncbi:PIG-L deacetylase family protein [Actinorugispora endophytica]|nr:PIG-L family deacetylase [Actinorugispora endophytica]